MKKSEIGNDNNSESWKILVQPWRFGSSCLSKALLYLERQREGENGIWTYLCIAWLMLMTIHQSHRLWSRIRHWINVFTCWGHSTEQGLASQCVSHVFFCFWEHLGSLKLLTLNWERCCSSFIWTIGSQKIFSILIFVMSKIHIPSSVSLEDWKTLYWIM